jgi:hypothetical protein
MSFLRYSKQLAPVASLPLCRFCPAVNYMHWLPQLHQLETVCDVNIVTQQTINQANNPKPLLCKAENHASNNFDSQPS